MWIKLSAGLGFLCNICWGGVVIQAAWGVLLLLCVG